MESGFASLKMLYNKKSPIGLSAREDFFNEPSLRKYQCIKTNQTNYLALLTYAYKIDH